MGAENLQHVQFLHILFCYSFLNMLLECCANLLIIKNWNLSFKLVFRPALEASLAIIIGLIVLWYTLQTLAVSPICLADLLKLTQIRSMSASGLGLGFGWVTQWHSESLKPLQCCFCCSSLWLCALRSSFLPWTVFFCMLISNLISLPVPATELHSYNMMWALPLLTIRLVLASWTQHSDWTKPVNMNAYS